jgi:hypothetical protein
MWGSRDLERALAAVLAIAALAGAALAAWLLIGLPWLWQIIKPWLHGVSG